jgi:hypothetical protein
MRLLLVLCAALAGCSDPGPSGAEAVSREAARQRRQAALQQHVRTDPVVQRHALPGGELLVLDVPTATQFLT